MPRRFWLALLTPFLLDGEIIDRVVCQGDPKLSYALYVPAQYSKERAWPILYCLDPGARGRLAVERFAKAAEAEGFLVAGSHDSRNGPIEPVRAAIEAMLADTHARFHIDDKRMYAAGFSGGARVALQWALGGQLAGVIACGAGFGEPVAPKQVTFALFAAAGVDDFNYHEMHAMSVALAKSDTRQRWAEFEGGHAWLPEPLALEALQFLNGRLPARAAGKSKREEKEAARFRHLAEQVTQASQFERQALVASLKSQAAASADSSDRRVARRVLGLLAVREMEGK